MTSLKYSKLLKLADIYLNASLKADARFWALGSLTALAQEIPDPNLAEQDPKSPIAESVQAPIHQTAKYPLFRRMLGYFGVATSDENWNRWLETNASTLGDLPAKRWSREYNATNIYTEIASATKYERVYLSADKAEPNVIDVTSASHLKSVGDIPTLWMFSGPYTGEKSAPPSKEVAYYNWAGESISRITGGSFDFNFQEKLEVFVIGHKQKLDSIRKWFKYEPKLLGGGSDGTAWDIGDRRILKIFADATSYNHALQAMDRLHNNPGLAKTEAMIYDAGEIGKFGGYPIYFYIMEKMAPVTDIDGLTVNLKHIVSKTVSKIYRERSFWRDIKKKDLKLDSALIRSKVKEAAERYSADLKTKDKVFINAIENAYLLNKVKVDETNPEEHFVPLNKNWLNSLVEEVIIKYLTGRTDLHMGNLGVTAYGDFRYFDPSFQGWESNVNMGGGAIPHPERPDDGTADNDGEVNWWNR